MQILQIILTAFFYRFRGGFLEHKLPKLLQHNKTFGMIGLCYVMYNVYGKFDYSLLFSQILFWVSLAGTSWIGSLNPFTKRDDFEWYSKWVGNLYDKIGVVWSNLIGLFVKGLLVGLSLSLITTNSFIISISLPVSYLIGWYIYDKLPHKTNYAEIIFGIILGVVLSVS